MKMSFHSLANKLIFALDLALKQRQNVTRKWPIRLSSLVTISDNHFPDHSSCFYSDLAAKRSP